MAQKNKNKKPGKIGSGKFAVLIIFVVLICLGILFLMLKTMTVDREKWVQLRQSEFERDSIVEPAKRGNILSDQGELLASNLPKYKIYFDFLAGQPTDTTDERGKAKYRKYLQERDSTILAELPTIAAGLAEICPVRDSLGHYEHILKGLKAHKRHYNLFPNYYKLNYLQHAALLKLPIFNMKSRNRSGLIEEQQNNREKPFGSLARRTLGEMFGAKDSARSGMELAYDTLLRGKPGMKHIRRIRSRNVDFIDIPPIDGYDLVSTINVSMQDICETALKEKLKELKASMGVCILMETKTGDVKAIVNLAPDSAGNYYEERNFALAALMEPGSTFKTASIMVALDDGEIKMTDKVDTGCGIYNMYGAKMKDSNWSRGGCGVLDVTYAVVRSSNIGVSRLIDEHYHNNPERFIAGLKRVGIGQPLGLPFAGMANPRIIGPDDPYTYWSGTSLPWMSIGYGTQIPPISTVTFYNAIANNGRMVRPRFVKALSRDGEIVEEFPTEVIREQICKPQTLKDIRGILYKVVNDPNYGTGRRARSKHFSISGKTGTAQVAMGGGYHNGRMEHLVSFCGFYPSEDPQYTCIVAIRTAAPGASGGGMAGVVFKKIAEQVLSKQVTSNLAQASDSTSVFVPVVKTGYTRAAEKALSALHVRYAPSDAAWTQTQTNGNGVTFTKMDTDTLHMPNLAGMGARDAIFALESRGLRTLVRGCGTVAHQSIAAGSEVKKGQTVVLELKN